MLRVRGTVDLPQRLGALWSLLEASPEFKRLLAAAGRAHLGARMQVASEATAFALSALWRQAGLPVLVVVPRPEDARRLYDQIVVWAGDDAVLHFPETETLPFERVVSDSDTTVQRLRTLAAILDPGECPPLVVASTTAIAQKTIARDAFEGSRHVVRRGDRLVLERTLETWRRLGYRFEPVVDAPGLVSRRGGVVDIYPVRASAPTRIELWGDEVDSLRLFDPATQRSTEMTEAVEVTAAREALPGLMDRDELAEHVGAVDYSGCTDETRERIARELDDLTEGREVEEVGFYSGLFNRGCLLDYLPDGVLLATFRPGDATEAAREHDERSGELRRAKESRGELPDGIPSSHLSWPEVEAAMAACARTLDVTPWGAQELSGVDVFMMPFASAPEFYGDASALAEEVEHLSGEGHRVLAVTSVPQRLSEILAEYGVDSVRLDSLDLLPAEGAVTVLHAPGAGLSEGFALTVGRGKLVVLSDHEIFGAAKQRRSIRRRTARQAALVSELKPGDYVVHVEHGIGRFTGTGRNPRDDGDREFLIIQYAQNDMLYVPVDHLDRVAPYVAPMDRPPSLTRLGSQEWKRAKARVARSTREMASELVALYAARELAEGQSFAGDGPWQVELEDSFPFEETPDQKETIVAVKGDMERARPMDRLVCGDVGYGKTEVALRAAFKAVMDGKQVAILAPTTVLAQQHYVTFSQRLRAYPVAVDVLSRFRSREEQRAVVEGLAKGSVDICIGTHRLVQKDVAFKDLGLVVIDEEQRFGVAHKERLKQMRHEVDVLTLTATPIPRTLHLSLAGIRDMSTIETPPEERLPIKTYVSEFSDDLIREAVRREIDRQGQVYFLHNRVHNIDYMAGYVQRLVPEATVGVAHGQMPEEKLERAMLDFSQEQFDVLVCTTIIESGLDIANVNTLIVNRADTFGLSQLYQLRGRVGRGARRAYAYLLIPPSRSLTETAEKRLRTMLAASELGAGFQIAMKDLEIRGAGNVLGSEQSGHIHALGFDLYTRLLGEAVEEVRARLASGDSPDLDGIAGEQTAEARETLLGAAEAKPRIDLGVPANIPQQYVQDLPSRLSLYRRIGGLDSMDEADELEEEMADRFGPLPAQVGNLMYMARLKVRAQRAGVGSIARENGHIVFRLHDDVGGAAPALRKLLGREVSVGHTQLRLELGKLRDGWEEPLMDMAERLAVFKERLAEHVITA